MDREVDRLLLRLLQDVGAQVLRSREDVKADEIEPEASNFVEDLRRLLSVHSELLRSAAKPHSRSLDLEIGIDAEHNARTETGAVS